MELILNLAWLLLALPAYWLWQNSRAPHSRRRFSSRQCLLALGCALVVLFPVVSATDDLHALCAAFEESPLSKRSVRQSVSEKAPAQAHQALVSTAVFTGAHRLRTSPFLRRPFTRPAALLLLRVSPDFTQSPQ